MIRAFCEGTALTLQGHAGAAPHGQDLVCAAVTGLVYALAQRMTELEGAFEEVPVIRLEPGDAQISVVPKREYAAEVTAAFRLVETGLSLLQTHYPEQIQIQDISQLTAR